MTREEAERVARVLVTVEDDSWDWLGVHYSGWIVRIGGCSVQSFSAKKATGLEGDAMGNAWREAIVRALVEGT